MKACMQGAYNIKPAAGAVVSSWPCQGVSLAAVHEQYAALASGSTVHVLHVSSATGKLQVEREVQIEQQVSALALFELKPPGADMEVRRHTRRILFNTSSGYLAVV